MVGQSSDRRLHAVDFLVRKIAVRLQTITHTFLPPRVSSPIALPPSPKYATIRKISENPSFCDVTRLW
jgi:hypothetical protein